MKRFERFSQFCTTLKVIGAEVASTVNFLILLYIAVKYEITHLLR